ncbi:MAG TPA: hypothetical protein P5074_11100, partial [Candidatus Nanopelagicales bacterium]|nr:hypothetical protein [Candidatus Nanopelagicales bacterium]
EFEVRPFGPYGSAESSGRVGRSDAWEGPMKRLMGIVVVVPLLFGGLAACGGGDDTATTETTAAATPAQTEAMEPTDGASMEATDGTMEASSAVDEYCQKVDEYAVEAKKLIEDPTSVDTTALQAKAQELQDTASKLTQELINDPSQATKVQECTTRLQEALAN